MNTLCKASFDAERGRGEWEEGVLQVAVAASASNVWTPTCALPFCDFVRRDLPGGVVLRIDMRSPAATQTHEVLYHTPDPALAHVLVAWCICVDCCVAGQSAACDPSVSPEPVAHLSQHRLVQLLHDTAQQLAKAAGADSSICFNREVTSVSLVSFPHQLPLHHKTQPHQHQQPLHHPLQQQPSQKQQPQQQQQQAAVADQGGVLSGDEAAQQYPVCVALSDNSQGKPQQQLVRCSYLVAADGSHSIIR